MSGNNNSNLTQSYNMVDVVKFICALFVIGIHCSPFGKNPDCETIYFILRNAIFRTAVPFFLVSAGFFLYKKNSYDNFSFNPVKKYVLKLLRLYIIWSVLYIPLSLRLFDSIISFFGGFIFYGIYYHLWYLPALIVAVLLVSFLIKKKVKIKNIILFALVFYAIGLLAQSWFGLITPLESLTPNLWSVLKTVKKIIYSTRNGLFEGFLFVAIGGLFAYNNIKINIKTAWIGFIVSYLAVIAEACFTNYYKLAREYDMLIFLIPTVFFMFYLSINIKLKDRKIYKTLRTISTLVFFLHFIVLKITRRFLSFCLLEFKISFFGKSYLPYIITVIGSIVLSIIIIKLSSVKGFKWLKYLYS